MNVKHGVTAVIFDERGGKRYFLLLHRVLNWSGWEFIKGGIDQGENSEQAVFREIDEEAGLTRLRMVGTLPRKVSWAVKGMKYIYTPFILKGDMAENVNLVQEVVEHDAYSWAEEGNVERMLTHEDNKKVFREAIGIINSQQKQK